MFTWTKAVRSKYSLPGPMPPLISTVSLAQVRFNDVTYWLSLNCNGLPVFGLPRFAHPVIWKDGMPDCIRSGPLVPGIPMSSSP